MKQRNWRVVVVISFNKAYKLKVLKQSLDLLGREISWFAELGIDLKWRPSSLLSSSRTVERDRELRNSHSLFYFWAIKRAMAMSL